jgi:hypothetical protein
MCPSSTACSRTSLANEASGLTAWEEGATMTRWPAETQVCSRPVAGSMDHPGITPTQEEPQVAHFSLTGR